MVTGAHDSMITIKNGGQCHIWRYTLAPLGPIRNNYYNTYCTLTTLALSNGLCMYAYKKASTCILPNFQSTLMCACV